MQRGQLQIEQPHLRRSSRQRRLPAKFSNYDLLFCEGVETSLLMIYCPANFKSATKDVDSHKWQEAMREEMESLLTNQIWDLVPLPSKRKALKNKWVYKSKEEDGGKKRYRARLVVKGYGQQKGIEFDETFSPVVKMTTIQAILGLAAVWELELEQFDFKTAFLHRDDEELYMEQSKRFDKEGQEHLYYRLKRSLYGLKQALRQCYLKFDRFMTEHKFIQCESDPCVYFKQLFNGEFVSLLLYVDDMLVSTLR